ncbi:MAG: hypothetical protein WCX12_00475 [Candidatus Paceibacterota bacterium]|jgi:hypothetical protein
MKRNLFSLLMVALFVLTSLSAAQAKIGLSVSNKVMGGYITGVGKMVYPEPVHQLDLVLNMSHGFYAEGWMSNALNGRPNSGREIDWTIGWSNKFMSAGICYIDLNRLFDGNSTDLIEPFVELTAPAIGGLVSPYVKGEHFHATRNSDQLSATSLSAGLKIKFQPVKSPFCFQQNIRVVHNDGLFGCDEGYLVRYEMWLNISIPNGSINLLQLRVFNPLSKMSDRKTQTAVGSGITFNF